MLTWSIVRLWEPLYGVLDCIAAIPLSSSETDERGIVVWSIRMSSLSS
jgi:hypothetical protein